MAIKYLTVNNVNTQEKYSLQVPFYDNDSDPYNELRDYLTNLVNNYYEIFMRFGSLPSGLTPDGSLCSGILESSPDYISGALLWRTETLVTETPVILYSNCKKSILDFLPSGTYTSDSSSSYFTVGTITNLGDFFTVKPIVPTFKCINPYVDSRYGNTRSFLLSSDMTHVVNTGSGNVYPAYNCFSLIYYNTTTSFLSGYTGYINNNQPSAPVVIGTKGIDLYINNSDILKPKPISPDEVDTTNEQVGNNIDYENVNIDVNVITPTDDNEENFSTSTITDTNIVSVYALTNSEVRSFSNYIWTAASQGVWQALAEQLQNPMDVILSLHTIPYANSDGTFVFATQNSNIALAGIDSGIASRKVLKDNFQDFVGSVNLNSFVRHNFVDFPPYTELSIYLPYLGYVDLDLNDFRDRVGDDDSLGLHYIVEPMTGNFVAKITSFKKNYKGAKDAETSSLNGTVMYSFSGNMARQLPLANRHYDILGGIMGIGSSLLMGGAQATMGKKPIGGIVSAVTGTVGSVIDMMTPKVSHSGNLGGNFGYLDSNVARIIMRSTPYYIPSNYGLTTGYVVNSYYSSFKNLLGLVVIENWIPKNMSRATLEEITELEKLLKEGVYFGDGIWNETTEQESD